MRRVIHRLQLPAILALTACANVDESAESTPAIHPTDSEWVVPAMPVRGYVTLGHEVRSFTPCDTEMMYWILDRSSGELQAIYDSFANRPYQPVFAIVQGAFSSRSTDGFGADFDGQLAVHKVWRAEGEGRGCDEDLSGFVFRASGNEPFWSLSLRENSIRLTEFGIAEPQSWTMARAMEEEGVWLYTALPTPQLPALEITVTEQPCRDSMSGAYFSFTAQVELGSRQLNGCAARGY
jgi:putative lipoprotein